MYIVTSLIFMKLKIYKAIYVYVHTHIYIVEELYTNTYTVLTPTNKNNKLQVVEKRLCTTQHPLYDERLNTCKLQKRKRKLIVAQMLTWLNWKLQTAIGLHLHKCVFFFGAIFTSPTFTIFVFVFVFSCFLSIHTRQKLIHSLKKY